MSLRRRSEIQLVYVFLCTYNVHMLNFWVLVIESANSSAYSFTSDVVAQSLEPVSTSYPNLVVIDSPRTIASHWNRHKQFTVYQQNVEFCPACAHNRTGRQHIMIVFPGNPANTREPSDDTHIDMHSLCSRGDWGSMLSNSGIYFHCVSTPLLHDDLPNSNPLLDIHNEFTRVAHRLCNPVTFGVTIIRYIPHLYFLSKPPEKSCDPSGDRHELYHTGVPQVSGSPHQSLRATPLSSKCSPWLS